MNIMIKPWVYTVNTDDADAAATAAADDDILLSK